MEDFDPRTWVDFFNANPVFAVLFFGMLGGSAISQLAKMAYLALGDTTLITQKRYEFGMYLFATLITFWITYALWQATLHTHAHGLGRVSSLIDGLLCPNIYKFTKFFFSLKFPRFVKVWGDNSQIIWKNTNEAT